MPWANNAETNTLRMTYNAALAAHADCSRAITDARMQGLTPPPELIEAEAKARRQLEEVRAKLLAAMTKVITGGVDFDPPSSQT